MQRELRCLEHLPSVEPMKKLLGLVCARTCWLARIAKRLRRSRNEHRGYPFARNALDIPHFELPAGYLTSSGCHVWSRFIA